MPPPTPRRLSGLQRDVLSLYRQCVRAIKQKPETSQANFRSFARREFEAHLHVDKKDFGTVEFLLRKGQRQLELYKAPGIRNVRG